MRPGQEGSRPCALLLLLLVGPLTLDRLRLLTRTAAAAETTTFPGALLLLLLVDPLPLDLDCLLDLDRTSKEVVEVERERLDNKQQREEDDDKRRARLAKKAVRDRAYYDRHKADPEWKEARAVKRAHHPSRLRALKTMDPPRASTLRQLLEA